MDSAIEDERRGWTIHGTAQRPPCWEAVREAIMQPFRRRGQERGTATKKSGGGSKEQEEQQQLAEHRRGVCRALRPASAIRSEQGCKATWRRPAMACYGWPLFPALASAISTQSRSLKPTVALSRTAKMPMKG